MIFVLVTLLQFANVFAQDANCDFSQNIQPGTSYRISSPRYPNSYLRGNKCRWLARCPAGYQIRLDCYLEMPLTSGCAGDQVLVSRTGDMSLTNADRYCGRRTLAGILSINQDMSIGLIVTNDSPGGRMACNISAQQIVVPPQQPCRCGIRKQNRIVGGTATGENEYTMMAGIIDNVGRIICGGVIISNEYILTAAHCLIGLNPTDITISIGNRNYTQGIKLKATVCKTHPNFNSDTADFDIALVKVTPRITYSEIVSPVCLPFNYRNTNLTGVVLTLLGWGTSSFGAPNTAYLNKVDVNVISQQKCRADVPNLTGRQICTYSPGKDACQNDSGGPGLGQASSGNLISFGIVSYGFACATSIPGVNTRVTEFLDWIVVNAPANYCVIP